MDYFDTEQESGLFPYVYEDVEVEDFTEDYDDIGNYDIYSNDWEG